MATACLLPGVPISPTRRRRPTQEEHHVVHRIPSRAPAPPAVPPWPRPAAAQDRTPYHHQPGRLSSTHQTRGRDDRFRHAVPGPVMETTAATVRSPTPTPRRLTSADATRRRPSCSRPIPAANPDNPWGHYMSGLSSWKAGDPEQALIERSTRRSVSIPSTGRACSTPRGCCWRPSRPRRPWTGSSARWRSSRSRRRPPSAGSGARYELARSPEAIDAYQRAIALDDRDVWAMNNLGLHLHPAGPERRRAAGPSARAVELRGDCAGLPEQPRAWRWSAPATPRRPDTPTRRRSTSDSTYAKASASLTRVSGPVADRGDTTDGGPRAVRARQFPRGGPAVAGDCGGYDARQFAVGRVSEQRLKGERER